MSRLFVDLVREGGLLALPIASMLFFLGVFCTVLVRTLTRRRAHYGDAARMPLAEDAP